MKFSTIHLGLTLANLARGLVLDPNDVSFLPPSDATVESSTFESSVSVSNPAYETGLASRPAQIERSSLCINLQKQNRPSKQEYQTIIGPWLDRTLQSWRASNPGYARLHGLAFFNYLTDRYAPDVTSHTKRCDLQGECTVSEMTRPLMPTLLI